MNFIIFCICIPLVHSVSHSFMTTYNGIYGKTIVGIPEFSSVTTLDEKQIDSYDSDTGTLIQDWMKEFASGDRWKEYTEVRERVQQINKLNIIVLMQQFSQSQGVHRYQRMYGCVWDDETEVSDGFDEYSYDGQRFISLDLKEGRYTAHVPQADPTVQKWNNDTQQLDFMKQYYKHECINWLKEFLHFLTKILSGNQNLTIIIISLLFIQCSYRGNLWDSCNRLGFGTVSRCQVVLKNEIFISIKLFSRWKHELHKFMTTYTGRNKQTVAGRPEFSAVTILDGQQIDYYDSEIKELVTRQEWMKKYASTDMWKADTEIRKQVQNIYKNNIPRLMERFNQTHGVHTYQRMYGCEWDDETEVPDGFDEYSYDGQRFISLDLKKGRYTAHVSQADPTVQNWNNDTEQLDFLKQYYRLECIYWLKEFLHFSKATLKKTGIVSQLPGQSVTEPIQKILTVNDTKSSNSASDASLIRLPAIILLIFSILALIALIACCWKKCNPCKKFTYYKKYDNSTPSHKSTASVDNPSEQCLMVSTE
ncbi:hypothetical protein Q8A67_005590 [Cirrhinus molitorella]|uniref:MHC class I-like antigen recognition-like domain-containing protein n=1 Tax=Cirrhinus molitorella TaxID=172907 RepID=A0AA88Q8G0_9TELE|nr:hypothetical protein Q8A67_005590 [Cirrhinus molitorella]